MCLMTYVELYIYKSIVFCSKIILTILCVVIFDCRVILMMFIILFYQSNSNVKVEWQIFDDLYDDRDVLIMNLLIL